MTTLEGLTDNEIPCAKRLSVAGFLALSLLFLLWFGFIPGLVNLS